MMLYTIQSDDEIEDEVRSNESEDEEEVRGEKEHISFTFDDEVNS